MSEHRFAYMPFFADDFLDSLKVKAMTASEMGCYIALLANAWQEGYDCLLPNNDRILSSLCHMSLSEWQPARSILIDGDESVFDVTDDGKHIFNARQVGEWNRLCRKAEINKENGSKGGRPKLDKPNKNRTVTESVADGIPDQTQQEPTQNPISDPISQRSDRTKRHVQSGPGLVDSSDQDQELFNRFWSAYPLKQGKKKAHDLFVRWIHGKCKVVDVDTGAKSRASPEDIIAAAGNYARAKSGSEYVKLPATFLAADAQPWVEWIHAPPPGSVNGASDAEEESFLPYHQQSRG